MAEIGEIIKLMIKIQDTNKNRYSAQVDTNN